MNSLLARLTLFLTLSCAALSAGEYEILPKGATVKGDYRVIGNKVTIAGVVEGDLYVLAGGLLVDGEVKGDIIGLAGDLFMHGKVGGSIRMSTAQMEIYGTVGDSISSLTANFELAPSSRVEKNLLVSCAHAKLKGDVGGNVSIYSSKLEIDGAVGGNVFTRSSDLTISPSASIGGNLDYSSRNPAKIEPGAHIAGVVDHHPPLIKTLVKKGVFRKISIGSQWATLLMNFAFSFVLGLILLRFKRERLEKCLATISHAPVASLFKGLFILILLPLLAIILVMTVIGIPFALTLIALNVLGFYSAKVITILWASKFSQRLLHVKRFEKLFFLALLIVYFLLRELPFIGGWLPFLATLLGLGSYISTRKLRPAGV